MKIKSRLLTLAGFVLLGVGAVGVLVPILPTTPFVISASACFAGNPRMRAWLMKSRFFAEYITNYRSRTGLRGRTVSASLAFLWATLIISMLSVGYIWLLSGIGAAVTAHILWIARPKVKRNANSKGMFKTR